MHFPGGGFAPGSIASSAPLCRVLAHQAGVRVLSVEYRLASEDPFPAGLADAASALHHVLAHRGDFRATPVAAGDGLDVIRPAGLLEADDLAFMPPCYVATAGFDPLRDEGEELAEALRAGLALGAPVRERSPQPWPGGPPTSGPRVGQWWSVCIAAAG